MNAHTLAKALIALFLLLASASLLARADAVVGDYNTKAFLETFKTFRVKYVWKSDNPCEWSGVLCQDGESLADLGLPGDQAQLSGALPSFPSDLNFDPTQVLLRGIYLNDNPKLTGTFPAQWSQMTRLQSINLAGTGLQGEIPASWQFLPQIMNIDLSNTKACMSLPAWSRSLSQMTYFVFFNISGDSWMRGTVPETWLSLASTSLDFTGTELCGCATDDMKASQQFRNRIEATNPLLFRTDCATANPCGPGMTKCGAQTTTQSGAGTNGSLLALAITATAALVAALAF